MIQRDFIKRQLEELGRAIGKIISDILKLKELGKVDEGIVIAQETLESTFDLDIENMLSLPLDSFVETLIKEKKYSSVHLNYLGDVLFAAAELFEQKDEKKRSKELNQRVLIIFNYIDQTEKTFSLERNNKIEKIKNNLRTIN
ncbi:MAG: hypothetical protein Q8L90_01720 [Bacteroidota bacterium]|nr:hypothetical protein [Bacteroidota bacterium]